MVYFSSVNRHSSLQEPHHARGFRFRNGRNSKILYIPKFHFELYPIKIVWSGRDAKHYTHPHGDYSFVGLEHTIILALDYLKLDTICIESAVSIYRFTRIESQLGLKWRK